MSTVTDIGTLLTKSPGICGGRLRIAGTGVSVRRIAIWYTLGKKPDETAAQTPTHFIWWDSQIQTGSTYYAANLASLCGPCERAVAEQAEASV